jgi:predicted cation transporter
MKYVFIAALTMLGAFLMEIPQRAIFSEWVMHTVGLMAVWFAGVLSAAWD